MNYRGVFQMDKKQRSKLLIIAASLIIAGCSSQEKATPIKNSTQKVANSEITQEIATGKYGKYSNKDLTVLTSEEAETKIILKDGKTEVIGSGVTVKENTITITKGGSYEISGKLSDGQLIIAADKTNDDVQILLNGTAIMNSQTSPFFVETADKVIVTLAEGSENSFSDSKNRESTDEKDGTIFSQEDLTFNGDGTLKVIGNYQDGIRSKDDLVFVAGNYQVTAANNGFKGSDSVSILAGDYQLNVKNDGIQSSNTKDESLGWIGIDGGTFKIVAEHDGIQAETDLKISQSVLTVTTGGGAKASTKITDEPEAGGMMGGSEGPGMKGQQTDFPGNGQEIPRKPSEEPATLTENSEEISETEEETEKTSDSGKGLKAGKELLIDKGEFTFDTVDDSLHADGNLTINNGEFKIKSGDDGIHANQKTTVNNGTIEISQSYEGIEGAEIVIEDGQISVTSSDDGINAASTTAGNYLLTINGGTIYVNAEGDGVDSNGDINMTGGTLLVDGPTNGGNGALDYDGSFNQTGGTLVGAGSSGMAMATSETSTQGALSLYFDSSQAGNTLFNISDSTGDSLISYQPTKAYQHMLVSSPDLTIGGKYQLSTGGKDTGTNTQGLYTGGQYSGDNLLEIELSTVITSISETGEAVSGNQMGGPGGGGPGSFK